MQIHKYISKKFLVLKAILPFIFMMGICYKLPVLCQQIVSNKSSGKVLGKTTKKQLAKNSSYVAGPVRSTNSYYKKPTSKNGINKVATIKKAAPRKKNQKAPAVAHKHSYRTLAQLIALEWPIEKSAFSISSPYGPRKNVDGSTGFHTGLDLAAVRGTPIKAAYTGIVQEASFVKGYGNMVFLVHQAPNGTCFKTRYAHCDKIRVQVGQKVTQGEIVATVGNTGNVRTSTGGDGSHLHLELYIGNKRVNPLYFLRKNT